MSRTTTSRAKLVVAAASVLLLGACAGAHTPGSNPCSAQNAAIGGLGLGAIGSGIGLAAGGVTGGVAGGLIGAGVGGIGGSQVGC